MNKAELWLNEHKEMLIAAIQANVRIKSVEEPPAGAGAPFGKGVQNALVNALDTAQKLGLSVSNLDGYAGCVDIGEGEEMLGVVCHVDVVPEGDGWSHPPYGAEIADGKLFGRGAMDNKGPAIISIFALAAINAAGLKLKRRVRLILGTNEETGWGCMEHYSKAGEIPTMSFSPDAEYPVVNSEKSIYQFSLSGRFDSKIRLSGGTRANVVCGKCELFVPLSPEQVEPQLEVIFERGFSAKLQPEQGGTLLTIIGLDSHASTPELGKNAMQAAFALLIRLELDEADLRMAALLNNTLGFYLNGEGMNLDVTDASGRLTLNPGVISWTENGIERLDIDVRHPISLSQAEVRSRVEAALSAGNLTLADEKIQLGHHIPADSELVSKLLDVYSRRTGAPAEPLSIGGGTYARAFPNAVAFGCERPGVPATVHMPDEYMSLEDIMFNANMITDAIIALACEE